LRAALEVLKGEQAENCRSKSTKTKARHAGGVKMQETDDRSRAVANLIRRDGRLREPLFEIPSRSGRAFAMVILVGLVLLGMYLLFHAGLFFKRFEDQLRAESGDATRIRMYNAQLESLQDRMTGFIAGSVEAKLKALENSVASGTVGAQEIRMFEELKNELKLLETYSAGRSGNLTDQARLDHPRFQAVGGIGQPASHGELLREVLRLKILLYFSIASCGLVGAMVCGYWWQQHSRFKRLQAPFPGVSLLTKAAGDESL
jgi:hypothetical protein